MRAGDARLGILVDGAGIGSAMAANKVPGVRAAPCADEAAARNAREHNDANVLTLGAKFVDAARMHAIVETFLTTRCTEERHARRVDKIKAIEETLPQVTDPDASSSASSAPSSPRSAAPRSRPAPAIPRPADAARTAWAGCVGHGRGPLRPAGAGRSYPREIARAIDHTLLKADATRAQIEKLCEEAREHGFATVCVNPAWVPLCADLLRGSETRVCTVVGFPLGRDRARGQGLRGARVVADGACEVDMVINVGALKSGDYRLVRARHRGAWSRPATAAARS